MDENSEDYLTEQEAAQIHDIIMNSGDKGLVERYEKTLEAHAEMRNGMHAMSLAWVGTELNEALQKQLADQYDVDTLYQKNLLSKDGSYIELNVLAQEQSDDIVIAYFMHDPKQKAAEIGVNYDEFIERLKANFKGTIGTPGKNDFGILLDTGIRENMHEYFTILGLGSLSHPYDQESIERLSQDRDLDDHFKIAVQQGKHVFDKGIQADSVYLFTPLNHHIGVQIMASELQFDGAESYTKDAV